MSFCLIGLYGASFYYVNPTSLFNSEYVFIAVQAILWHDLIIFIGIFTLLKYKVYTLRLYVLSYEAGFYGLYLLYVLFCLTLSL